jgi:hypothetical protein
MAGVCVSECQLNELVTLTATSWADDVKVMRAAGGRHGDQITAIGRVQADAEHAGTIGGRRTVRDQQ